MNGQLNAPVALTPRKNPVTHQIKGCVSPSAAQNVQGEKNSLPGFEGQIIQPVT